MHIIQGREADAIYKAVDNGSAIKVPSACFVDRYGDEILIDFYQCGGKVFRCEHDRLNIETRLEEVTGRELLLFREIHGLD